MLQCATLRQDSNYIHSCERRQGDMDTEEKTRLCHESGDFLFLVKGPEIGFGMGSEV